eukprot:COSAG03_NODE_11518_length_588_cov_1.351738_1_plen_34_part_10
MVCHRTACIIPVSCGVIVMASVASSFKINFYYRP